MTINISGILKSPQGSPIQNAEIIFEQTRTSTEVLAGTKFSIITNQSGNYSTTIGIGTFIFKVRFQDETQYRTVASNVIVTQSMNNYTINQVIQDQTQLEDIDYDLLSDVLQARDAAQASATAAAASQATSSTKAAEASSSAASALASKNQASNSETNAQTSKNQAQSSQTAASGSQTQQASSQATASTKASDASNSAAQQLASKNAAQTSEANALASKNQAASSQLEASASQTQAQDSQNTASTKASEASQSQTQAQSSQTTATTKASQASSSQTQAQGSQTTATTKATEASNSQTQAQGSQTTATTKATEASNSQTLAQKWAANPENTVVSGGLYSALHYAAKAAQSAQTAVGQLVWRGGWSAQAGTAPPTPQGTTQDFYRVTQAGTILGVQYEVGDYIHWDNLNSIWFKMDGTDSVTSVNGRTGAVVVAKADVGLNLVNNWGATSAVNDASNTKYATAGAVKTAYDLAAAALPKNGGGSVIGMIESTGANGKFQVLNPNDGATMAWLGFLNDRATVRYGGTGVGSTNGFQVVGVGDSVKMYVDNAGEIFAKGTEKVFHTSNLPTAAQVGALDLATGGTVTGGIIAPSFTTTTTSDGTRATIKQESGFQMLFKQSQNTSVKASEFIGINSSSILYFRQDLGLGDGRYSDWKVYHQGLKPTAQDVGLPNVNNWGASSQTNNASTTTYATTAGVKQAYDLASSKLDSTGTQQQAAKLQQQRDITLSGGATGQASFDGSQSINIQVQVQNNSHTHTMDNVSGLQEQIEGTRLPLPDVWAPLTSDIKLITGIGTNVIPMGDSDELSLIDGGYLEFTRTTSATYIDRTGVLRQVLPNQPRFETQGLLIEGPSTNLAVPSEQWSASANQLGQITHGSPDVYGFIPVSGTSDSSKTEGLYRDFPMPSTGTVYTFSLDILKAPGMPPVKIRSYGTTEVFEVTLTDTTVTGTTQAVRDMGLYWRVSATRTSSTGTTRIFRIYPFGVNIGSSGTLSYRRVQLESMPFATSYIPTTVEPQYRSGDFCFLPYQGNLPPLTDYSSFTIALTGDLIGVLSSGYQGFFSERGAAGNLLLRYEAHNGQIRQYASQGTQITDQVAANIPYKLGYRFSQGLGLTALIGNTLWVQPTAKFSNPGVSDKLAIGSGQTTSDYLFGHIKNLRIWCQQLSDQQLIQLQ